jgi:dTDP-4-amino-4,6-dideoxy-D-galactose acyltransferase
MYHILDWDSNFFGFKVAQLNTKVPGKVEFNKLVEDLRNQQIKLVYTFIDPSDIECNQNIISFGGKLVDEKTIYKKLILKSEAKPVDPSITIYTGPVTEKLESLSIQTSHKSRFRIDTNFKDGTSDRLFKQWIANSVNRINAQEVWVYWNQSSIAGLITLSINSDAGKIGLIGVDTSLRNKGIGFELLNCTEHYLSGLEISRLEVVTQRANIEACRFYEKNGFSIDHVQNVYHLWITD